MGTIAKTLLAIIVPLFLAGCSGTPKRQESIEFVTCAHTCASSPALAFEEANLILQSQGFQLHDGDYQKITNQGGGVYCAIRCVTEQKDCTDYLRCPEEY